MFATETTARMTKVINPTTNQVAEVTGRSVRRSPRGSSYVMLRVTGGEYHAPAALKLA